MEGVVFTMYDARTNLSLTSGGKRKRVIYISQFTKQLFQEMCVWQKRLVMAFQSIYMIQNLWGAESYRLLAEEVLSREEEE